MTIQTICILFSSLSFYLYVALYFLSPHMKNEFKRFNLEKLGRLTIILEFLGATGLLVGIAYDLLLPISSAGLSLLMLCGLIIRVRLKDSVWISLPAGFFMLLNFYIFYSSLQ